MDPGRLERALTELGASLDYPDAAMLAPRVRARIAQHRPRAGLPRRRLALLIAAALLLLVGTAVAVRFAVRGVEVRERPLPVPASPLPTAPLALGERVSLAEARARMGFPVSVPRALGAPDEVWVGPVPSGGRVSLLYRARAGLPQTHAAGAGALLTQFAATVDDAYVLKEAGPSTKLQRLTIGDRPAFWLEGDPHSVVFVDRHGEPQPDRVRLAGNVLLWQRGRVTFRLEAEIPMAEAVRIASSLD